MKLIVKPSDLIKRFIWDKYETFKLHTKNKAEIDKIIKEDVEFEITEKDAFVIGLTGVIYTDNIVYKLKQFLKEILDNKSFDYVEKVVNDPQEHEESEEGDEDETYIAPKLMINKDIMIDNTKLFLNKIPKSWDYNTESVNFIKELAQIPALTKEFIEKIHKLPTTNINEWQCLKYVSVKKLINKTIKN